LSGVADEVPKTAAPRLADLGLDAARPLVIVDVDEVLGHFLKSFIKFIDGEGLEFRLEQFALFENIYRAGESAPVPMPHARSLFDSFFRTDLSAEMEPAPGAVEALAKLHEDAEIVVLSNAPRCAEPLRALWLRRIGLPHPLILNMGVKGPITAALAAQSRGRSAFVDDQLVNLDSVAEHSPETKTFQHVADERLRPLAPRSDLHLRIDDWRELGEAIRAAVVR
jgi:hypothetical protein